VRDRLAPLGVRPFGRLLSSYTINELGDSVGVVALAVLVFDRTQDVIATAAFFMAAKFLPALVAPALTARLDQVSLRRSLPGLYLAEAIVFAALALIAEGTFVLPLVLLLGLLDGSRSRPSGAPRWPACCCRSSASPPRCWWTPPRSWRSPC
jgi:hypothetical protein